MNYPNMSYCAVENTAAAMDQILALIDEAGGIGEWIANLDDHERGKVKSLLLACSEIAEAEEDIRYELDSTVA